jgi:phenylacetic acid degradation operon negative regulatory protein
VPRSLLMTFFGAFLRRLGGWIAVADLIALMAELGLDAQSVRSSV